MVGGVVIPDGSVEAAASSGKVAVRLVGELIAFNVQAEYVGIVRAKHDLGQKTQALGKLGGEEQIKLTRLKGGVGYGDRVAAGSAATIDDGKNKGIGNRSDAEVEV